MNYEIASRKSLFRIPWRLRIKFWLHRIRLGKEGRILANKHGEALDREFFFGQ